MSQQLAGMREREYKEKLPPEFFDRSHKYARENEPGKVYTLVRILFFIPRIFVYRLTTKGRENVPAVGSVVLAPNHSSFADHFLVGARLRRRIRFAGKSQIYRWLWGCLGKYIFTPGGVFPVRRGVGDEEVFITARILLRRGSMLGWYAEGRRSRSGQIADQAKYGIGRVVLESGASVVPVAIHGSNRLRNWRRLQVPRITVWYGEAVRYEAEPGASHERQQEVADEILDRIRELYAALEFAIYSRRWKRALTLVWASCIMG